MYLQGFVMINYFCKAHSMDELLLFHYLVLLLVEQEINFGESFVHGIPLAASPMETEE